MVFEVQNVAATVPVYAVSGWPQDRRRIRRSCYSLIYAVLGFAFFRIVSSAQIP
jgi:hypothetical protein